MSQSNDIIIFSYKNKDGDGCISAFSSTPVNIIMYHESSQVTESGISLQTLMKYLSVPNAINDTSCIIINVENSSPMTSVAFNEIKKMLNQNSASILRRQKDDLQAKIDAMKDQIRQIDQEMAQKQTHPESHGPGVITE